MAASARAAIVSMLIRPRTSTTATPGSGPIPAVAIGSASMVPPTSSVNVRAKLVQNGGRFSIQAVARAQLARRGCAPAGIGRHQAGPLRGVALQLPDARPLAGLTPPGQGRQEGALARGSGRLVQQWHGRTARLSRQACDQRLDREQ